MITYDYPWPPLFPSYSPLTFLLTLCFALRPLFCAFLPLPLGSFPSFARPISNAVLLNDKKRHSTTILSHSSTHQSSTHLCWKPPCSNLHTPGRERARRSGNQTPPVGSVGRWPGRESFASFMIQLHEISCSAQQTTRIAVPALLVSSKTSSNLKVHLQRLTHARSWPSSCSPKHC